MEEEGVVIIITTTARVTNSAIFISVRPTIAAVTKTSLNFTELVHIILFDEEARYIRCLLLLRGAAPTWIDALIGLRSSVFATAAF